MDLTGKWLQMRIRNEYENKMWAEYIAAQLLWHCEIDFILDESLFAFFLAGSSLRSLPLHSPVKSTGVSFVVVLQMLLSLSMILLDCSQYFFYQVNGDDFWYSFWVDDKLFWLYLYFHVLFCIYGGGTQVTAWIYGWFFVKFQTHLPVRDGRDRVRGSGGDL